MKNRIIFKAVAVFIVFSFFVCDANFAAVLCSVEENEGFTCLSPAIHLNQESFVHGFKVSLNSFRSSPSEIVENLLRIEKPKKEVQFGKSTSQKNWLEAYTTFEQRYVMATGNSLVSPMRLEIHPYHFSQRTPCNNNCGWCTRAKDKYNIIKKKIEGIPIAPLLRLIRDIKNTGVQDVVISGNSTEPLLYPWIEDLLVEIKKMGLPFRLFSNFYYGFKLLKIAHLFDSDDIVRISLDAGSESGYNLTHKPSDKRAFFKILRNIEQLLKRRKEIGNDFQVHMTYLLSKENSDLEDIRFITEWARDNNLNSIRFSPPLKPKVANDKFDNDFVLSDLEIEKILDFLNDFKTQNPEYAESVAILEAYKEQPEKKFEYCHHWKMIAVLGTSGMFFPCTSTSLVESIETLGVGPLKDNNFNFLNFWNNKDSWKKIVPEKCLNGKCADCTRWEFVVNKEIDRLRTSIDKINRNGPDLIAISI